MATGLNQVTCLGGLTKDPEVQQGRDGGSAWLRFSLACGRNAKDRDGQWREETDYVPCIAFGRTAENIEKHCVKGTRILVMGSLKNKEYKTRDGERRWDTRVYVSSFCFAGGKRKDDDRGYDDSRRDAPPPRGKEDEFPSDFSEYEGGGFSFREGPQVNGEEVEIPF